jgi:integral membrane protein (TIGR00529 family)
MIILKLIVAMVLILYLSNKTKNIGLSLIIGGSFLALISMKSLEEIFQTFIMTSTEPLTIELLLAILFISILGYLMDQLEYMNRMIEGLENVLRSVKLTILLTPAIVGTLLVTGGALMSCPMVETLGNRIGLSNEKKATVNLIFRHGLYFIYPLSPPMILAIKLGGFDPWAFIRLMLPMSIAMYFVGYFIFLKDIEVKPLPKITVKEYFKNLVKFLYFTSPIILSVLGVFVLGIKFHYSLALGILWLVGIQEIDLLMNKGERKNVLKLIPKGISIKMLLAIFGIMYFKNIVGGLDALNATLNSFINSGFPIEIIILFSAALISYTLASTQPGIAILFPLILPLASTMDMKLLYGMFIYVSAFMFYYASPLHMCQVLTLEYFDVSIKKLYSNYKVILPVVYVVMIAMYVVNSAL